EPLDGSNTYLPPSPLLGIFRSWIITSLADHFLILFLAVVPAKTTSDKINRLTYNMEPMLGSKGWLAETQPRFMALLPPPPTIRFRSEPRFPTNKSLAEFGHHIVAGLHDYSDTEEDRDIYTAFSTEPLARFNQHAINRAIQDLAKESALELAKSLVPRLKARFEDRNSTATPDESSRRAAFENSVPVKPVETGNPVENHSPPERTEVDESGVLRERLADTTSTNTSSDDLLSDDLLVKDAPDHTEENERNVAAEFDINSVLAKKASQLALHDFIILADDCNSVEWGIDQTLATKEAIQGIFRIANIANPQRGVNLQFFNDAGLTGTSHIGSAAEIKDAISRVGSTKGQQVPCPLHEKVLQPLTETIEKGELQHPTIVAIITSGVNEAEPVEKLADIICDFKDNLRNHSTNPGVFLVFLRVGADKDAGRSLGQLEHDERIHDIVSYSKENLVYQMNLEASKSGTFISQLVELLAQPIAKNVLTILINISTNSEVLKCLAEDDAFLESILLRVTNPKNVTADDCSMLLANLSKSPSLARLLSLKRTSIPALSPSPLALDQLIDLFNLGANGKYNPAANFDYLAYVFADLAKPPISILPFLLLPLCAPHSPSSFTDEEVDRMLPELQYLGAEQKRESNNGVLAGLLEVLYLLVAKGDAEAKETVRAGGTYYVVRELHLAVEDEGVREGCDRLVQVLMQDDEGTTVANNGGTRTEENFKNMNAEQKPHDDDDDDDRVVEIF
ncbi:hypothetical protein MMC07_009249, partial [Pseudocyphellaria aurata]|nr:hypothetical protein [Pseudocyphellaria aurata]